MALEHLTAQLTMGQETLAECLTAEAKALLAAHWVESSTTPGIAFDPNYAAYEAYEAQGALRCYILREQGVIQGYAVFFVMPSTKCQTVLEAWNDLLYVSPTYRRGLIGARFIVWCDEQLAKAGVQFVRHGVQRTLDFGPLLARLGYEQEQTVWCHRLDQEVP